MLSEGNLTVRAYAIVELFVRQSMPLTATTPSEAPHGRLVTHTPPKEYLCADLEAIASLK